VESCERADLRHRLCSDARPDADRPRAVAAGACDLGASSAAAYLDGIPTVQATLVDPDGPASVIVEDAS